MKTGFRQFELPFRSLSSSIHKFRKYTKIVGRQQWTNDSHFTSTRRLIVCLSRFAPTFNNKQLLWPLAWNHIKYYNLSNIIGSYLQVDCQHACRLSTNESDNKSQWMSRARRRRLCCIVSCAIFWRLLENAEKKVTTMRNSSVRILFFSSISPPFILTFDIWRYFRFPLSRSSVKSQQQ